MQQDEREQRRKRDLALRSMDERIAEHLEQARRSGELARAESYGKPLADMQGWQETPAEFRMPFKILRNADACPPEIELFHRRAALRQQIEACSDDTERVLLMQKLSELEQFISLRLEHLRVSGSI
jgi:hypothetical protein